VQEKDGSDEDEGEDDDDVGVSVGASLREGSSSWGEGGRSMGERDATTGRGEPSYQHGSQLIVSFDDTPLHVVQMPGGKRGDSHLKTVLPRIRVQLQHRVARSACTGRSGRVGLGSRRGSSTARAEFTRTDRRTALVRVFDANG
jgi:hypothetical protein